MKFFFYKFTFLAVFLSSVIADASVSSISSPNVKEGKVTLGVRASYAIDEDSSDNKKLRTRQTFNYGLTSNIDLGLVLNQEDPSTDSFEHRNFGSEIKYQFTNAKTDDFGSALRLRYTLADNDKGADNFDFRYIFQKYYDDYEFRSNIITRHDVGAKGVSGVEFETRFQIGKKFKEAGIKAGFELFNDFDNLRFLNGYDNQKHEFGPFVSGKIGDGLSYHARALAGVSKGAEDLTIGIFFKKSF